ncbi:23S rRNA (pseudouridine(1915)-N(3))-methyltransferase RlmH [Rhodovulum adriaticum]|nr:23S rRNA (pseudouridine(1915)-N(3))-methyltransferase RlmH [Rhodovulum adriaticum]
MNIDIICIGNIKEKYYTEAIKEYLKRLTPYSNVNIIELDEHKLPNKASNQQIEDGMEKEGEAILSKIGDRSYVIPLCIEGRQLNSKKFAGKIEDITLEGYSNITFIIGGSYGLSPQVKAKSNLKLSFSKMTFPHQLMRVILLEQIYRAFRILRNEPYHK